MNTTENKTSEWFVINSKKKPAQSVIFYQCFESATIIKKNR